MCSYLPLCLRCHRRVVLTAVLSSPVASTLQVLYFAYPTYEAEKNDWRISFPCFCVREKSGQITRIFPVLTSLYLPGYRKPSQEIEILLKFLSFIPGEQACWQTLPPASANRRSLPSLPFFKESIQFWKLWTLFLSPVHTKILGWPAYFPLGSLLPGVVVTSNSVLVAFMDVLV